MARSMGQQYNEAFRIGIRKSGVREDGSEYGWDLYYGPYATLGAAKGMLTRELRYERRFVELGGVVEGWIEKSSAAWERVE